MTSDHSTTKTAKTLFYEYIQLIVNPVMNILSNGSLKIRSMESRVFPLRWSQHKVFDDCIWIGRGLTKKDDDQSTTDSSTEKSTRWSDRNG